MNFTKVQGAGNDFILIEAGGMEEEWSRLARAMCDRHFGIGGDGLLLLLPSAMADFKMRVFNPDGSEAEACGNGLRCFVRYVLNRGLVGTSANYISVDTEAGIRQVNFQKERDRISAIQVGMGVPRFGAKEIPVALESHQVDIKPILGYPLTIDNRELSLGFVSMGNPHAVYFSQHPVSEFPLSQIGPEVAEHRLFPNRINFEVAHVVSGEQIEVRVWERGAGETLACGTGACAVAVTSRLHGYTGNKVDIELPGGVLNVEWDGTGEVFLSGPAEIVFDGHWPE